MKTEQANTLGDCGIRSLANGNEKSVTLKGSIII